MFIFRSILSMASMIGVIWLCLATSTALFIPVSGEKEYVLTLDHSNFTHVVTNHDFVVVNFYAPWSGHCQSLAPEYEKAAKVLSNHDPPIVLAKVDAFKESSKELSDKHEVQGFPTIKMFRDGGKSCQDYKGPRDADGIVAYLTRQLGPPSKEIKSAEDAKSLVGDSKFSIVGIFPNFEGEEFQNFLTVAEIWRFDYEVRHTLDAKLLPLGDASVTKPTLRVFKPFDERVQDTQNFHIEAMQKFVKESTLPLLTYLDTNQSNLAYLKQYFEISSDKAMLFVNYTDNLFDSFKLKIQELATQYKVNGLKFLIGDLDASDHALDYFKVKPEQAPLILVQSDEKFLKTQVTPDELAPWLEKYLAGEVKPFATSQPIPENNDEPVKVVVTNSLKELFIESKKNVLLDFYVPWCGHCQKLAPTLDEIAVHFENDPNVVIAKFDATQNDIPMKTFNVISFPTLYFKSANGKISIYEGDGSKEDFILFIGKNRDDGSSFSSSISSAPSNFPSSNDEEAVNDEL